MSSEFGFSNEERSARFEKDTPEAIWALVARDMPRSDVGSASEDEYKRMLGAKAIQVVIRLCGVDGQFTSKAIAEKLFSGTDKEKIQCVERLFKTSPLLRHVRSEARRNWALLQEAQSWKEELEGTSQVDSVTFQAAFAHGNLGRDGLARSTEEARTRVLMRAAHMAGSLRGPIRFKDIGRQLEKIKGSELSNSERATIYKYLNYHVSLRERINIYFPKAARPEDSFPKYHGEKLGKAKENLIPQGQVTIAALAEELKKYPDIKKVSKSRLALEGFFKANPELAFEMLTSEECERLGIQRAES